MSEEKGTFVMSENHSGDLQVNIKVLSGESATIINRKDGKGIACASTIKVFTREDVIDILEDIMCNDIIPSTPDKMIDKWIENKAMGNTNQHYRKVQKFIPEWTAADKYYCPECGKKLKMKGGRYKCKPCQVELELILKTN